MHVTKVASDLSDPGAAGWSGVGTEAVGLAPIPIDAQPTEYVRTKWSGLDYGNVSEATVAAAHDGTTAWVRLEWADSEQPNVEFPDCAAVYFSPDAASPAATIGDDGSTVDLWFWRSDEDTGRHLSGNGPGVFRPLEGAVAASAALVDGRWAVVLGRPVGEIEGGAHMGVAVWDGSNEERAGIGSATTAWLPVSVES